jgi:hypothetical protein
MIETKSETRERRSVLRRGRQEIISPILKVRNPMELGDESGSAFSSITNLTWVYLELNPRLPGEKPE